MSLQCQKCSYLREFEAIVLSCKPTVLNQLNCYEVLLNDTILFPAGGGQPSDHGQIAGFDVINVERRGDCSAVHYIMEPVMAGQHVTLCVDWARRFDHMQQHSGQHLITAIADQMYHYKTTSWNLATGIDGKCFIELSSPSITDEELQSIEDKCNECIRNRIAMRARWLDPDSDELKTIRTRGLPDDVAGPVRVIDIEGIDSNMCCGTHVNNLSDIQAIKLLYAEQKKGNTIVYYIAGNRVFHYLGKTVLHEKKLTKLLCTGTTEHCDSVERILKIQKQQNKIIRTQLRELAKLLSFQHLHNEPVDPLAIIHRDDGDNEFMNIIASELTKKDILVFVTVGDNKTNGQFLLASNNETLINDLGPKVTDLLDGKGGGRKGRYQGKVNNMSRRSDVATLLREAIQQK
ncbi:PREDICTED: alanyl-tRNA editing protein Aarsd1-like [Amphimedon queenslandica]|uniref:Threonyl/alanyl tRNA synthetase SAD domain-containing protein n=1 Tax=Amphimedon queenslandica TaxID=400682 RepID=A0A1X7U114_AMPQE|nr:PREDICTED: alanyl-tRNA editing protein Aarsd1-like [Amphimedon queenslandica]|eukprot:XP_003389337.1 PREDICTED: alanyl-tRNA editing protein Aarsd1-like [Amphimedon queenslandica]